MLLCLLPTGGRGAAPRSVEADDGARGKFSLLPKSFQRAPWMDVNVMTEYTKAGFGVPRPTADNPTYYIAQAGGQKSLGAASGGEPPPPVEELTKSMVKALTVNHYLESPGPAKAPTLAVFFNYGSAVSNIVFPDEVTNGGAPLPQTAEELLPFVIRGQDTELNMVIERASLVGGAAFARELKDAIEEEILMAQVGGPQSPNPISAFQRLLRKSDLHSHLIEVAFHSCYFVVASAYDARALARGERVLLWRTKITVDSDGISMKESLLPLIVSAAEYLGVPMAQPAIVEKRITTREGKVIIGDAKVVEEAAAPTSPAASAPPPSTAAPGSPAPVRK